MIWHLTVQLALYLLVLPIFGMIGYRRGWRRELFLVPFVLAAVLFLYLNEGKNLAQFLTQLLFDKQAGDVSSRTVFIVTLFALAVIVGLGYIIGGRMFPKPATPQDRVLGIIPASITGFLVMYYITTTLFPATQSAVIGQGLIEVDQIHIGYYILVLFIILAIVLVVRLVAASAGKKK